MDLLEMKIKFIKWLFGGFLLAAVSSLLNIKFFAFVGVMIVVICIIGIVTISTITSKNKW